MLTDESKDFADELEKGLQRLRLERLASVLRGKVLRRSSNQYDGGYGSSSYYEKSESLHLYEDGTFSYEEKTFTSISSGGMSLPSERRSTREGTWAVEYVRDEPALILRDGDEVFAWWHTKDGGTGVQYLDGERWNRYLIN